MQLALRTKFELQAAIYACTRYPESRNVAVPEPVVTSGLENVEGAGSKSITVACEKGAAASNTSPASVAPTVAWPGHGGANQWIFHHASQCLSLLIATKNQKYQRACNRSLRAAPTQHSTEQGNAPSPLNKVQTVPDDEIQQVTVR